MHIYTCTAHIALHRPWFVRKKNSFSHLFSITLIGPVRAVHSVFVITELRREVRYGGTVEEAHGGRLSGLQGPGMLIGKIVLIRPSSLQMLGEG